MLDIRALKSTRELFSYFKEKVVTFGLDTLYLPLR